MTIQNITKLTQKYSPKEITVAVKVLVDILAMQKKSEFKTIDPREELTPYQIKRLQKQLAEHKTAKELSLNEVVNVLGL